jgi:hypothetical protein
VTIAAFTSLEAGRRVRIVAHLHSILDGRRKGSSDLPWEDEDEQEYGAHHEADARNLVARPVGSSARSADIRLGRQCQRLLAPCVCIGMFAT